MKKLLVVLLLVLVSSLFTTTGCATYVPLTEEEQFEKDLQTVGEDLLLISAKIQWFESMELAQNKKMNCASRQDSILVEKTIAELNQLWTKIEEAEKTLDNNK
jgi:hypothetical protein